jgi:hypothetical protein
LAPAGCSQGQVMLAKAGSIWILSLNILFRVYFLNIVSHTLVSKLAFEALRVKHLCFLFHFFIFFRNSIFFLVIHLSGRDMPWTKLTNKANPWLSLNTKRVFVSIVTLNHIVLLLGQ